MEPVKKFNQEVSQRIIQNSNDDVLKEAAKSFMNESIRAKYSYNFSWMGRPIIQYPQDIVAMQELIWRVQPDLIIETGIAHGGSLIFSASMLELNAINGGSQDAFVIGIDIDIRPHNRQLIESHVMSKRIHMIEGSSLEQSVINAVKERCEGKKTVLVCLDSDHTHEHVLRELQAYSSMVSVGSYCVVFDTVISKLPDSYFPERAWCSSNNPMSAVKQFIANNDSFVIDENLDNQFLISVAPRGFLKRVI